MGRHKKTGGIIMSGGHFDYQQYRLHDIASSIEELISSNNSTEKDEFGCTSGRFYSENTIQEFKNAVKYLKLAEIYAQRVDWLVSCDDGEETFHRRLQDELVHYYEGIISEKNKQDTINDQESNLEPDDK